MVKVPRSVKNEILSRQRNRCRRCDGDLDPRAVEIDHIHPKSEGGDNDLGNLQALCPTCHKKKTHEDNIRKKYSNKEKTNNKNPKKKDKNNVNDINRYIKNINKDIDDHANVIS